MQCSLINCKQAFCAVDHKPVEVQNQDILTVNIVTEHESSHHNYKDSTILKVDATTCI